MNRYERYGQQLHSIGYDVTPVHGKVPILKGWSSRPSTAIDFTQNKDASVGLVCGGQYNVIAIDIDVRSKAVVNVIRKLADDILGVAPERIGNPPKTLFVFRCTEAIRKVKTAIYEIDGLDACVEILAEGQQFVASGMHPDTKSNYHWPDDTILEIPPFQLTTVTPDDISIFMRACNTALGGYGRVKAESLTSGHRPAANGTFSFAENEQATSYDKLSKALLHIPNEDLHYDDWVYTAHAIKGAVGEQGRDLFHLWSDRSNKSRPVETDRLWNSIGEVLTIGAGSIFHMAAQHGFDLAEYSRPKGPADIDYFAVEAPADRVYTDDTSGDSSFTADSVHGPLPEREWLLENWFPAGTTAMLFGAGGVGKTLLVHQLANCVASGKPFMGLTTKQMPVLCVFCEDDSLELKRRQLDINKWIGVDEFGSGPPNLTLWPRIGSDNILVTFPGQGEDKAGDFFEKLCAKIVEVKNDADSVLVVLDTAADMFGGSENARREVNTFIKRYLGSIAIRFGATVIVLAHPSLSGLASGSGLSGSTAWENSVRSRAYLARADGDDLRVLSRKKSNYSSLGAQSDITLIWDGGVLTVPTTRDQMDRVNSVQIKEAILTEVDSAWHSKTAYRSKISNGRRVHEALPNALNHHPRAAVRKAFYDLVLDGNIVHVERKGYKVEKWLIKSQVIEK